MGLSDVRIYDLAGFSYNESGRVRDVVCVHSEAVIHTKCLCHCTVFVQEEGECDGVFLKIGFGLEHAIALFRSYVQQASSGVVDLLF